MPAPAHLDAAKVYASITEETKFPAQSLLRMMVAAAAQRAARPHRSRIAFEATSTSGENRYSSIRRAPVLSSTVTAMPDVSG